MAVSGSKYENELLGAFESEGWRGMRAPASGTRDGDSPDLLVGKRHTNATVSNLNGHVPHSQALAIELKATSSTTAYVDADEVDALERFAKGFGAVPLLAVRPKRRGTRSKYYLIRPHNARMTDSGRYGLPVGDATERACAVAIPETRNAKGGAQLRWFTD